MSTEEILHELDIKYYGVFNVFGVEVWLTQSLVALWISMAVIIVFALIVRANMKKWKDTPRGLQNVAEIIVETFDKYVESLTGKDYAYLGNYFFGVVSVVWVMNISGLWLMRPPTADISMTVGLALVTFLLIHFMGITKNTKQYFKELIEPNPIMLPLNIVSELATPMSLAFRLFGSTLGGFIIITLAYSLLPSFLKVLFPMVLHGYFDMFAASLQAFIFLTLSLTFIRSKLPE